MNRRKTYTYKWPREKKPGGLALDCHMKDGKLRFFDTLRGHSFPGEVIVDGEDDFIFLSTDYEPGEWVFRTLTIEDVRRGVVMIENGDIIAKTISTTDDLQEWYWKTFGEDEDDGCNHPDVLDD